MALKRIGLLGLLTLNLCLSLVGCKKSNDDEDANDAKNAATGSLILNFAGSADSASASFKLTDPLFKPSSIASGAPDSLDIYVTEISLRGKSDNGSIETVKVFSDTDGKKVSLKSGVVDISNLFTTFRCVLSDGTILSLPDGQTCECGVDSVTKEPVVKETVEGKEVCPEKKDGQVIIPPSGIVTATAMTYDTVDITYNLLADMKGCVSATFAGNGDQGGAHTYCTNSNHYLGGDTRPAHSDFETTSATTAKVPLSKAFPADRTSLSQSFTITNGLELKSGDEANLSIVLDANRLLRFYNQGRTDTGPNPGFPTDYSYFFTTIFDSSIYVFAGKTGSIRGYEWLAKHCKTGVTNCESETDSNNFTYVQGWFTVVYDVNQTPMIFSAMPDDDNTLTILKGGNTSKDGTDASAFVKKDSTYNISGQLGTSSFSIAGFNLDLAVDASQNTTYTGLDGNTGIVTITRRL